MVCCMVHDELLDYTLVLFKSNPNESPKQVPFLFPHGMQGSRETEDSCQTPLGSVSQEFQGGAPSGQGFTPFKKGEAETRS